MITWHIRPLTTAAFKSSLRSETVLIGACLDLTKTKLTLGDSLKNLLLTWTLLIFAWFYNLLFQQSTCSVGTLSSHTGFSLHMDCRILFVFKVMDDKYPNRSNVRLTTLSTTYFIDGASVVKLESLKLSSIMLHWIRSVSWMSKHSLSNGTIYWTRFFALKTPL